jgi:hypothetical protein
MLLYPAHNWAMKKQKAIQLFTFMAQKMDFNKGL